MPTILMGNGNIENSGDQKKIAILRAKIFRF